MNKNETLKVAVRLRYEWLKGCEEMNEIEEFLGSTLLSKEELFIRLLDLYGDMVKRVAFTYVKDIKLAEDIVQEVFIKCYNNLASFQGKSKYKTWIYRITINHCKDMLRKKFFLYSPFNYKNLPSNIRTPEDIFLEKDKHSFVTSSLLNLSKKYREILYLYYYEELKLTEISEVTGLNIETIKTRLRRGKMLLKKEMERSKIHL